jgi:hypothetical protein
MMRFLRLFAVFSAQPEAGAGGLAPGSTAEQQTAALHAALRAELQRADPDWSRVAELERALAPRGRLGHVESRIADQRWDLEGADPA